MDMEGWKHEIEVPMHVIEEEDDIDGAIVSILLKQLHKNIEGSQEGRLPNIAQIMCKGMTTSLKITL
jgi:hypothetical protein